MTGILIATHHNLAGAFLETVEMIAGKHDFVESVGLCAGQDPEDFGRLIADKIEQFHQRGYQEVVVLSLIHISWQAQRLREVWEQVRETVVLDFNPAVKN